MKNDLRYALRMIGSHRWFSAAVVITLALGIGINTTVFTLVNAVLFKPVPLPGGERLVVVDHALTTERDHRSAVAYPDFREYRAENRTFEGLEAVSTTQGVISENTMPPERFNLGRISTGLFGMLRTPPILGRAFATDDAKPGAEGVALISHVLWQKRYAGAADVIGRAIRINGAPATIVGVMPDEFRFPNNEDFWMPLVPTTELESRTNHSLRLFGLLKPGVSIATATEDLAVIGSRLSAEFPDTNKDLRPSVRTFHETFNGGPIRAVFLMMLGAVGFVLLIACANVANMLLSRAIVRRREIAVRAAMGASRWHLVRQLLVESVLLSVLGGVLGLGLALFGIHAFDLAVRDVGKPYWIQFHMDYRACAYFAAISVASGLLFGLIPALRASRVDLNTMLKDDSPSAGSHRGNRLTAGLVVLQFSLTVVLLAGAGMMIRSFFAAQALNAFVPAEHIFTARVQLPEGKGERYEPPAARLQFHETLLEKLAALPGVTHVATASSLPGLGAGQRPIEIEGRPNENLPQAPQAAMIVQTPDYLPAIGLPLLVGRGFETIDGDPGKEAAVVTREFAAKHWRDQPAVGQRFRFMHNKEPGPWITVIGVCADIVQEPQNRDAAPLVYITHRQEAWGWMAVLVRTTTDPASMAGLVRATVQELDADLPLFEVTTLPGALERRRWFLTVFGTLFATFALTGLLMASVGIYAVVAQGTARRTREIGIRMALGATAGGIMRLVLARGLTQLVIGLVLGLVGAFGATQLLAKSGILMRVSPNDPLVFIAITTLLVAIGLLACWLPARRAARIAPTEALRTN
jgi:predicted permease